MKIEICTNSFRSAKIAAETSIDRVELCQCLEVGGITPSAGDILLTTSLKQKYNIEVFVLIRARGGDFCFSKEEYEVMRQDILFCKNNGVDGIVIGGLTAEGEIDIAAMKTLLAAAGNMKVTFHRAFDYVNDPFLALEQIIDLGFMRILTSGQKNTAIQGKETLKQLVDIAADRICIMPGGGVDENNIKELVQFTGAKEIHFTGKALFKSHFLKSSEAAMSSSGIPEYDFWLSNADAIGRIKKALNT